METISMNDEVFRLLDATGCIPTLISKEEKRPESLSNAIFSANK
jgi:hypothetical protein